MLRRIAEFLRNDEYWAILHQTTALYARFIALLILQ